MGPFIDGYDRSYWQRANQRTRHNRAVQQQQRIATRRSKYFIRISLNYRLYRDVTLDSPQYLLSSLIADTEVSWKQKGRELLHDYANNKMDDWPAPAKALLHKAFLKGGSNGQSKISGEQSHRLIRKLLAVLLAA